MIIRLRLSSVMSWSKYPYICLCRSMILSHTLLSSIFVCVDIRCITTGLLLRYFLSNFVKLSQLMQWLKSAQCSYCHRQLNFELQTYTIPWTPILRIIALCSKVSFYGADSEVYRYRVISVFFFFKMLFKRIIAAQINLLFFFRCVNDLSRWCI